MRKILLINYYFPPSGGPAVQRWLSLIRHLLDNQLLCYVISPDPQYATYPLLDLSLLEQVPSEVLVFRTQNAELFDFYKKWIGKGKIPANNLADEPNPTFLQKIARFVRGNFFLPDPRRAWNKFAYEKAKEIIRKENIELIITAGPPHSTHLVGHELQEKLGVKWIADLHDYWTDISYLDKFYRTRWANWIDRKYERQTLENADLPIFQTAFFHENNKTHFRKNPCAYDGLRRKAFSCPKNRSANRICDHFCRNYARILRTCLFF